LFLDGIVKRGLPFDPHFRWEFLNGREVNGLIARVLPALVIIIIVISISILVIATFVETPEDKVKQMVEYVPQAVAFIADNADNLDALLALECVNDDTSFSFFRNDSNDGGWSVSVADISVSSKIRWISLDAAVSGFYMFSEKEELLILSILDSIDTLGNLGLNDSYISIYKKKISIIINSKKYQNGTRVEMRLTNFTNLLAPGENRSSDSFSYAERIDDSWYVEVYYFERI